MRHGRESRVQKALDQSLAMIVRIVALAVPMGGLCFIAKKLGISDSFLTLFGFTLLSYGE